MEFARSRRMKEIVQKIVEESKMKIENKIGLFLLLTMLIFPMVVTTGREVPRDVRTPSRTLSCDNSSYITCGTAYSMSDGEVKTDMCGEYQYYKIILTQTCDLTWTMTPSGAPDIYDLYATGDGTCPSLSNWDCRPYSSYSQEACIGTDLPAGTYYAMVNRYSGSGSYSISADVTNCGVATTTTTTSTISTTTLPVSTDVLWTFMVYLDGDNNLEGAGIDDVNEMEVVGSSTNVKIVVEFDRISGHDSSNGDWTGTRRYYITQDSSMSTITSTMIEDLGEVNMGDPDSLVDFIEWSIQNYPAENYALVLWNHGAGWRSDVEGNALGEETFFIPWEDKNPREKEEIIPKERKPKGNKLAPKKEPRDKDSRIAKGIVYDDTDGDHLTIQEIEQALNEVETNIGEKIDLLGFDACLMQMIEVAYQAGNHPQVVVGSEETEPFDGWPYDTGLLPLKNNPAMSPQGLGSVLVDEYLISYGSYGGETQSAVNQTKLLNLATTVDNFAQILEDNLGSYKNEIKNARTGAQDYQYAYYIDLYDFARLVRVYVPNATLQNAALAVMQGVNNTVIKNARGTSASGSYGLSIYFPATSTDYFSSYENTKFATDTGWDEFLRSYTTTAPTTSADDYEPDNSAAQASDISTDGSKQTHNFHVALDKDYVKFDATAGESYTIKTSNLGDESDTYMYFYDTDGITLITYDDDGGDEYLASKIVWTCSVSGTYYVRVEHYSYSAYGADTNYDLSISTTGTSGDAYEPDDTYSQANYISTDGSKQTHNFHVALDKDYVKFDAVAGESYVIETSDLGDESDTYMYLYNTDGTTLITYNDDGGDEYLASKIVWTCSVSGTYYVGVEHYSYSAYGPDTNYNISILGSGGPTAALVSVSSPTQTLQIGSTFTVNVTVANATDLYLVQFDLLFNSSVLQCDSFTDGGFLGSTIGFNPTINNTAGTVAGYAKTKTGSTGVSGSGTLATIQFTTLASGTSDLALNNTRFLDSVPSEMSLLIVNGTITVISETEVMVNLSSQSQSIGATFNVDVNVLNVTDLYTVQFDLSFNSSVIRCDSFTEGSFLGTTIGFNPNINNTAGTVTGYAKTKLGSDGVDGTGTLATLQFTTLAAGTSTFTLSKVQFLDSSLSEITTTESGASITVTSSGAGDINGDGSVGLVDLALLGQAWGSSSGDANWNSAADLNSDGTVNLIDLALLGQSWGNVY